MSVALAGSLAFAGCAIGGRTGDARRADSWQIAPPGCNQRRQFCTAELGASATAAAAKSRRLGGMPSEMRMWCSRARAGG